MIGYHAVINSCLLIPDTIVYLLYKVLEILVYLVRGRDMKKFIGFIAALMLMATPVSVLAEKSPTTKNNGGGYDGCATDNIALAAKGCTAYVNGQWLTSNGDGTVTTQAGNVLDSNGNLIRTNGNAAATVRTASAYEFRFDHDFAQFASVLVDDVWVDPSFYTARSGSTIITLKQAFIDTLSEGTHKLTVTFNDAAPMHTTFVVSRTATRAGTAVPNTGDVNYSVYYMMFGGALIVMAGAGYILYTNKH